MKKIMGIRRAKTCTSVMWQLFWYLSKNRRIRPEIFACRTPMYYHEFAHECSSLNLIFGYALGQGFTATPFPRDFSFKFRDKLCNVGSLLLACPMSANGLLQPKCAAKINIYFGTNKFLPVFFHFYRKKLRNRHDHLSLFFLYISYNHNSRSAIFDDNYLIIK